MVVLGQGKIFDWVTADASIIETLLTLLVSLDVFLQLCAV